MSRHPNFIFLIADDHRAESVGFNCPEVKTPNLDRLAARGTVFDNAHCQGSMQPAVCAPSRASLMTGRNVFASSDDPNGTAFIGAPPDITFGIPADLETFPQRLRQAGYQTHAIGKWHNDVATFARSFSSAERVFFGGMSDHDKVPLHDFDPTGAYLTVDLRYEDGLSTDLFEQSACKFLVEDRRDAPFCLYVAFTAPHDPRTPPDNFRVEPASVRLPNSFLPIHPFDNGEALVRDELLEALPRVPEAVREHLADYYGMIAHMDAAIGSILDTADQAGLLDNTVIIYTADHGLALGQHGLMGKQNLYQHSINIPLIMAGPTIPQGKRVKSLVWHADTRATVLDLAGISLESETEGVSLLAAMSGSSGPRTHFCAVYRNSQRMVRDERYKLIQYFGQQDGA